VKRAKLEELSTEELTDRFAEAGLEQFRSELRNDIAEQNKCVDEEMAIVTELKKRPGDQRSALLRLYEHPNVQVRLNAAKLTFAVAPTAAREVVQAIADSKQYPQAGDAGMCLWAIEQGIFKPT